MNRALPIERAVTFTARFVLTLAAQIRHKEEYGLL